MSGMPALQGLLAVAALAGQCQAPTRTVEAPAISYAYASDLGSGIYDWGGRTLQIYRAPLAWTLRPVEPGQPGIRLRVPVTTGFLDFKTSDFLEFELPGGVDMVNVSPGLELEFRPTANWSIRPRAELGFSLISAGTNAYTAGVGVDADYIVPLGVCELQWSNRASYTHVDYEECLANEDMGRVRSGLEWRRSTDLNIRSRQVSIGVYGFGEWVFDPPMIDLPNSGYERLQMEIGVMVGLVPMPEVYGIKLPRLGLGYHFAGDFSGWRFVIGGPL